MSHQRLLEETSSLSNPLLKAASLADVPNLLRSTLSDYIEAASAVAQPIFRVEIDIPVVSPLRWLASQVMPGKSYYCNRENTFEMAAIGIAAEITDRDGAIDVCRKVRALIGCTGAYAIGGFRFESEMPSSSEWSDFGKSRFVIPRFDVIRSCGKHRLGMNILTGNDFSKDAYLSAIDSLTLNLSRLELPLPSVIARDDIANKEEWITQVASLLEQFTLGDLEKAVLARKTSLAVLEPVDAISVLTRMHERESHCYGFAMEDASGRTFVSVSPERLFCRDGVDIEIEAMAGTRGRSTSPAEDDRLADELCNSSKDVNEHHFVEKYVREKLRDLCTEEPRSKELAVVRFRRVQHLRKVFSGTLRQESDDDTILRSLHPTPAVAGTPSMVAKDAIRSLERFDRGWYAGPIGVISADGAEFAVGIRSALVEKGAIHLYAGCGIVKGSDPLREWDEVETKISGYMELFDGQ